MGSPVIVTPRIMLREMSALEHWADLCRWLNDQPSGRWYSPSTIEPHVTVELPTLMHMLHAWEAMGWMESQTTSDGVLWRPTSDLPVISEIPPNAAWGWLMSARLALRAR